MFPLLLAVSLAFAEPNKPFPMLDVGVTLNLPPGWAMTRWSDDDFKAKSTDGGLQLKVWSTPFQVEITDASAKAWADMYASDMKAEGFDSAEILSTAVETIAGRPTAHTRIALRSRVSGATIKVMFNAMAFEGQGQVVHAYTLGLERVEGRASQALTDLVTNLKLDNPPRPIDGAKVSTTAGFATTLPEGWRAPLGEELDAVLAVTAKLGQEAFAPDRCWVAIRPPPVGDPDVITACKASLYLGPVDAYSFEGTEPEVHEKFFGKVDASAATVPPAEPIPVGDRIGFYFKPENSLVRLAVTPYESVSVMMTWGLGNHIDAKGLDDAMKAVLAATTFTGPDGGKPQIGADRWIGYYLRYRTFSPFVLGPFLLLIAFFVGIARLLKKKKPVDDGYIPPPTGWNER